MTNLHRLRSGEVTAVLPDAAVARELVRGVDALGDSLVRARRA